MCLNNKKNYRGRGAAPHARVGYVQLKVAVWQHTSNPPHVDCTRHSIAETRRRVAKGEPHPAHYSCGGLRLAGGKVSRGSKTRASRLCRVQTHLVQVAPTTAHSVEGSFIETNITARKSRVSTKREADLETHLKQRYFLPTNHHQPPRHARRALPLTKICCRRSTAGVFLQARPLRFLARARRLAFCNVFVVVVVCRSMSGPNEERRRAGKGVVRRQRPPDVGSRRDCRIGH